MAAGDLVSAVIGADGWWVDLTFSGLATGGTYDLGLGPNNDPDTGTPKLAITVVSLGFDTTGAPTTVTRTVYGTRFVRKPYPDAAQAQESNDGTNTTVRVALSDYVFAKDATGAGNSGAAPTITLLAGLYTGSQAATAAPVTNGSTRAYPKVVGNWAWPGYDKLGATFPLRAVAFHASAAQGRPVQCVRFTATDGTNTTTTTVAAAAVDSSVGDDTPVVEYIGTMDGSGLTQGAVVTCNFVAYPRIGDTAACLDTSQGAVQPTPLYGPQKAICDKTGAYCTSVAVVDATSGNDSTGAVTGAFDQGNPPAAFATMLAAFNALRTYNNTTYSRNNCGGSRILLKAGTHPWVGAGTITLGTTPDANLIVEPFPGVVRAQVIIGTKVSGSSLGLRVKIRDCTITGQIASGNISLGAGSALHIDRCDINCPTANQPPFYINTVWHVTRSLITNLHMGLRFYSTVNAPCGIVRGCTTLGMGGQILVAVLIGNGLLAAVPIQDYATSQTAPAPTNTVCAFNRIRGAAGSNTPLAVRQNIPQVENHGLAIVQNLIEITAATTTPAFQCCADSTTQTPVNNALIWNNTVVGQRTSLAYNEVDTSGLAVRLGWSVRNNIFDDVNIKSDTFAGSGFAASGAKVGNWSLLYGCGCSGNFYPETAGMSAAGNFQFEMPGTKSYQPPTNAGSQPPSTATNPPTYPQFVSRKSFDGTAAGTGGGDYHVAPAGPAGSLQRHHVIPFDLAGVARSTDDAAGAYSKTLPVVATLLPAAGMFAVA